MKIKLCGITNKRDYRDAVLLGADFVGFIFYPKSPRYVEPERVIEICGQALPGNHRKVGVFVNERIETVRDIFRRVRLDIVQLHGDESPGYAAELGLPYWKAIRVKDRRSLDALRQYNCKTFLLDTYVKGKYGGTGISFDPQLVEEAVKIGKPGGIQIIASGGISVENIEILFRLECPVYAVDVNSSVEEYPGKKSREKMERFFEVFNRLRRT
ncbi:MAG: N-(5'-phosphoribosyl)anthranilate isomerase [Candidatus Aminicenantes bacterium]|nr:N-(5'-phosphoribosyl)anthranilate isomerase [Candidatus Aminicenantes bacterium]NIM78139.1 N-(5'-phosphoribosyl)anthranilate isomerase [Candidatus Aminicenantes bacterium]NIN17459.1 N-(5'-phosphoribosyl)anthranilate isomerase [Candidatus Aminicenantes bacterium]NIN41355.1 N-(5'-phosphoribosyl)anthranilate isomerase [Candidatus Aminicenantes bacterium]NIN84125.1 N-(5'-phosphoribosyl)anthranilate isomerase [Candidatus Aminicenantes bacterium]